MAALSKLSARVHTSAAPRGQPGNARSFLTQAIAKAIHAADTVGDLLPFAKTVGKPLSPKASGRPPVILVGGMGSTAKTWGTWARSLKRDGFNVRTFEDPDHGLGDVMTAARRLSTYIDQVKRATGAKQVELVGYSSGGHVARAYVQLLGGAANVHSVVMVSSPNHGCADQPLLDEIRKLPVIGHDLAEQIPTGEYEELTGSPLMNRLAKSDKSRGHTRFTSIYSASFDGAIEPVDSPRLAGATNIALRDDRRIFGLPLHQNHYAILHYSDAAYEAARKALLG